LEQQFYLGFYRHKGDPIMTLTKAQLVESIHNNIGLTKNKSSEIVETCLEIIKSELESGEDVLISGFGKFCVREKKERKGRNPATGDAMFRQVEGHDKRKIKRQTRFWSACRRPVSFLFKENTRRFCLIASLNAVVQCSFALRCTDIREAE
jgi:integration host factor subunit alpha